MLMKGIYVARRAHSEESDLLIEFYYQSNQSFIISLVFLISSPFCCQIINRYKLCHFVMTANEPFLHIQAFECLLGGTFYTLLSSLLFRDVTQHSVVAIDV
jgi:hypothetical protein